MLFMFFPDFLAASKFIVGRWGSGGTSPGHCSGEMMQALCKLFPWGVSLRLFLSLSQLLVQSVKLNLLDRTGVPLRAVAQVPPRACYSKPEVFSRSIASVWSMTIVAHAEASDALAWPVELNATWFKIKCHLKGLNETRENRLVNGYWSVEEGGEKQMGGPWSYVWY